MGKPVLDITPSCALQTTPPSSGLPTEAQDELQMAIFEQVPILAEP
jgi:hypothetical protein